MTKGIANNRDLQTAMAALQAGSLKEAERLLQGIIRCEPRHVPALNLLGVVLGRLGRNGEAIASYDKALAVAPNSVEAWYGRAMTLLAVGRSQEAIAGFDRVLAAKPDFVQVHLLRAKLLTDMGRRDAALAGVDKLLAVMPGLAEAWLGRSNILFEAGRQEEALSAAQRAIALKPALAEAWHGLGNALNQLSRHDEAFSAYDKALALNPGFAGAWHGRGNVLNELKRYHDALASYNKALALAPNLTEAWLGRGNILNLFRQPEEALTAFDRALKLNPNLAEAWLGRGNAFCERHHYDNAVAAFDRTLKLNPNLAEAWLGFGNVYMYLRENIKALDAYDRALALKPDIRFGIGDRLHVKLSLSCWINLDAEISDLSSAVRAGKPAISPFQFLALSQSAVDELQCAKCYVQDQTVFPPIWRGEVYSHDRIRIAYLSADFHDHATAHLIVGLLESHDRSQFEITGISFGHHTDSTMRRRLEQAFEHFMDVREKTDNEIAELLRRLEIDIAVDLKGLTKDCRIGILARRPVPIQVGYLGFPGTMGASYIDYILADSTVIPEEHFRFYSEQVVWLPDTYQSNDSQKLISDRKPTRAECGLPEDAFVFCCFNNTYKINPQTFDIWMRLLAAKSNSVLWSIEAHSTAVVNLRREAERRGIAPDRIIFAPRVSLADHLARSKQADLFLDTLPYNAHTTASDALWAGVPVLTCLGQTFAGRVAASLLRAVGLSELITTSLEQYEALALKLAHDPTLLAAIRRKLAENRNTYPLFDTARFTRHIESAFVTMWERYQKGEAPKAFAVNRIK